ncbi:MAG: SAM-dependent methyltransferase [Ignavibacteriae bacterium]|nr:SAM-dependent methyltransferase [Ignavibacteriota bacterium]MCB9215038.1 SAM-dependent methyltransferase [Ignavibacteria bacterium]
MKFAENNDNITLQPVAYVRNHRPELQDDLWGDVVSEVVLVDTLAEEAFEGITEFSHLEIIFHFDRVPEEKIIQGARHPRGNQEWPLVGIFAQRGKNRPNRLGLTIVRLLERNGRTIRVVGLDAVDGTPVLDIKPVMREFLPREEIVQPEWSTELMSQYWK